MNYSEEEVRRQIRLGEDSLWEFKQIKIAGGRLESPKRDDLADEIAAFANAKGGKLLCGVTDQGDVQGLSRDEIVRLDSIVVEVSSDAIKPAVRIHTCHVELDGKLLLVVEVPQGESQHDSPSGPYLRVGASKRKMTSDERLRLSQRRGQARFRSFDEQAVPNTGYRTLDESLWKPLLSVEGAANTDSSLRKLALLTDDESGSRRATVAGGPAVHPKPRGMAPRRAYTGYLLPGAGSCLRPDRHTEDYRPAKPADRGGSGLRHEEHAGSGPQGPGPRGPAAVQR
ncbi:MAG: ATP-binding protein [Gemmatimonadetes bacterium]|nr:ATP-binding protein [Gemmatimonadota bacterium]